MVYKLNVDKADEVAQDLEQGGNYWVPAEGRNRIRIMPPWAEDAANAGRYFFETAFHYGIGPDERTMPCPLVAKVRETCYLCGLASSLKKSSDEDDQAEAKDLFPKRKYLLNVVDLAHPEKGVQVWAAGVKAMRQVHYYVRDREYGDITDLDDGYDLIVEKTGSGLNTEYFVKAAKRSSAFPSEDLQDKNPLLADVGEEGNLTDLATFLDYASDAEMKATYEGTGKADSKAAAEEEEEEEEPRRAPSRRATRGRDERAPTRGRGPRFPDEEKEEPEEEEEEEEEEKAPAARPARRTESASRRVSRALRTRGR